MKSAPEIIDALNEVLTGELTGDQPVLPARPHVPELGLPAAREKVRAESIDEMKHADKLIERILFLEGVPNLQRLGKLMIGETVPEQFEVGPRARAGGRRAAQQGHRALPRRATTTARATLFEEILVSEEEHLDWLETQLALIDQLGEANYLAQQVR